MNLGLWAEQFRTVETDGAHTVRVRLLTPDDEVWHTWERDEITRPDWNDSVNQHLAGLADNMGKGKHRVLLIAEDHAGNVRSQYPTTVTGRSSSSSGKANEISALVQGMDALARTCERMMALTQEYAERSQKHSMALLEENGKLQARLAEQKEEGGGDVLTAQIVQNIAGQIGPVLEVLPDVMRAYSATKNAAAKLHAVPMPK
jgi:hypothetical protein